MTNQGLQPRQQKFETVLAGQRFKGLKAILDSLCPDRDALCRATLAAKSYAELLASLGYRLVFTKQIHVQDAYSRTGPAGGIRSVFPYYDIPTQSSLPTLVNFDATVTTTDKSATFFDRLLLELRTQVE